MSIARKTATYGAAAAVTAIAIIAIASLYAGPVALQPNISSTISLPGSASQGQQVTLTSAGGQQTSSASQGGSQALFIVQLTDPPTVPSGTTSLNLTYSAINLVVAEPGQNNQVTTSNVAITPQGGSATVDLLKLQNVSQTIASASLPNGSKIYSVGFTLTGISIAVNGVVSPVTLATGGNTFDVSFANPAVLGGTTAALLELNPIVVNSPTGYQMIPSAVGVLKGHSETTDQDSVIGSRHQITNQDNSEINDAKGKVSARLVALAVSGTNTTVTVQINNTGSAPVRLVAIGLQGNFTRQGPGCTSASTTTTTSTSSTSTSTSTSTHSTSTNSEIRGGEGNNSGNNFGDGSDGNNGSGNGGGHCNGGNEVVFAPLLPAVTTSSSTSSSSTSTSTSSTSSTSTTPTTCTAGKMSLVNGDGNENGGGRGLSLAPGQCVNLTFTGPLSFGQSSLTIIPSTGSGQSYTIHVIASNSAETMLNCVLPLTKTSCSLTNQHND